MAKKRRHIQQIKRKIKARILKKKTHLPRGTVAATDTSISLSGLHLLYKITKILIHIHVESTNTKFQQKEKQNA